ncbi:hypothetical protein ACIGZJ_31055 [Kitasatospora sp. NPDC052868]|uniref:hypothetical protein n=1 Tax=Kitasatospora sp. NPDC052868 TaxID=3364060 RepID=UPI0037CB7DDD
MIGDDAAATASHLMAIGAGAAVNADRILTQADGDLNGRIALANAQTALAGVCAHLVTAIIALDRSAQ